MKIEKYAKSLTGIDMINTTLMIEKGIIIKFALNYSAKINGAWHAVYRVDNYHGFLHEQHLWRTKKPIPLKADAEIPINCILEKYENKIKENYKRYRKYLEEKQNADNSN